MVIYFVIAFYVLASFMALVHPRFALLLFWPVVLFYPTWFLFALLPLNMGLDDVFLICLFIGSLIKSGGRPRVVWPVVAAVVFWALTSLGNISSVLMGYEIDMTDVIKRALKETGLILLVFSMSSMITTPEHIKKMLYSLFFGATLASIQVIFYTVNPYALNPFQLPHWALRKELVQAIGSFGTHDEAGGVLGFTVLIGYFLIRSGKGMAKRYTLIIITGVMFLGLLLSGSRSGWVFILVPLAVSSFLSREKVVGFLLLALMIIVVFVGLSFFPTFSERAGLTAFQLGGKMDEATGYRYNIWLQMLSEVNIRWLFFGEGLSISEYHPHSNYIGMLKLMGLAGTIYWIVYYTKVFKRSAWLVKRDSLLDMSVFAKAVFWAYIGYFVYFITCTPLMWASVRYVDFFVMTLLYLRYKQVETEEQYVYQDELYESDQAYAQAY
jgi:hypothetical protein